ncbi:MAG TPA: alpha-glucosidase/alpha-galactosidase [Candidatus Bathyarchaeia archaeon]|nr:alpha-glucosidase/alpha-galactosidase [Candidatus Bathyarchaeia archaeon]
MPKIAFLGAGSTVFAKNVLGDCLNVPALRDAQIALVDIDGDRLRVSDVMLQNINRTLGASARISAHLAGDAQNALRGADYVVNAIQVGGYEPATVIDFETPKKYGLRQTIGDTLGIGGIFRALRTIPVMLEYCRLIERVAPDAWLLNYANPMAMLTGAILKATGVKTVGLCHSVQSCAKYLCWELGLPDDNLEWKIAGVNHQGWLLEISRDGEDLYPEIRRRAQLEAHRHKDSVRFEVMKRFGYYVTESSEHTSEYVPWFIKARAPELIDQFHIPLDEYPRRCISQIKGWDGLREFLLADNPLEHERGDEYASYILEAIETGAAFTFGGNVLNRGLITNLPEGACVEVMCVADRLGVTPTFVGDLPPQCAALTRTNVNVHELTIEAALTRKREHIYHAALLDPHTAAELTIDEIVALCDDLIEAHKDYLPEYV